MMMEELLQEEFQAGKEKGKIESLAAGVLDIFTVRNMMTDSIKDLVENASDINQLQEMLRLAVTCNSNEEFLKRFAK